MITLGRQFNKRWINQYLFLLLKLLISTPTTMDGVLILCHRTVISHIHLLLKANNIQIIAGMDTISWQICLTSSLKRNDFLVSVILLIRYYIIMFISLKINRRPCLCDNYIYWFHENLIRKINIDLFNEYKSIISPCLKSIIQDELPWDDAWTPYSDICTDENYFLFFLHRTFDVLIYECFQ